MVKPIHFLVTLATLVTSFQANQQPHAGAVIIGTTTKRQAWKVTTEKARNRGKMMGFTNKKWEHDRTLWS